MKNRLLCIALMIIAFPGRGNPLHAADENPSSSNENSAENIRGRMRELQSGPVPYKNMREALQVLKTAKDRTEAQKVQDYFPRIPVDGHEDLAALYEEARKREDDLPLVAEDKTYDERVGDAAILSSRLRTCTDPAFHDDIAVLLEKESAALRREGRFRISQLTMRMRMKSAMRYERLSALVAAAGDGKNEKARATLWKLIDWGQGDEISKEAAQALGKMRHPEDLDRFVEMFKQNPELLLPLGKFGSMVIPRVMREIDDPNVPQEIKTRLAGSIVEASSHETLPILVPLLHYSNPTLVEKAADAIGKNLLPEDESLIRELVKNPSRIIRGPVLVAIENQAWKDGYADILIDVLRNDPDYVFREGAAHDLGVHKVQSAVPFLRKAASRDQNLGVRGTANFALKRILGK